MINTVAEKIKLKLRKYR